MVDVSKLYDISTPGTYRITVSRGAWVGHDDHTTTDFLIRSVATIVVK